LLSFDLSVFCETLLETNKRLNCTVTTRTYRGYLAMNIDPRPTCKRAVRFYLPGMSSRNCRSLFTNHGPKSVIIEDEREFCASHSDSIGRPRALPVLSIAVDAGGVGQISRTPVRRWPGNPSSVLFIRADHAAIAGSMIFNRIAAEQTSRCSEAQPTCRLPEDPILSHSPGVRRC
jgi:hypothetical protein